jgi:hypothetical protein
MKNINKQMGKKSKKNEVLIKLFEECESKNDFKFHNDTVKNISRQIGFGNPFDVTKIDSKNKLPDYLLERDYALIHLGNGYHQFIKGVNNIFHPFEDINRQVDWNYHPSILNGYNSSESNSLSVANNQRILHHFTFETDKEFDDADIIKRPKTYFPHRTKTNLDYYFDENTYIKMDKIQLEIDLTIEYQGIVAVFEAKNGKPKNFNIFQIYHPFLYYFQANIFQVKEIFCVYYVRETTKLGTYLSFWKYTFENPRYVNSIKCLDSARYKLIKND